MAEDIKSSGVGVRSAGYSDLQTEYITTHIRKPRASHLCMPCAGDFAVEPELMLPVIPSMVGIRLIHLQDKEPPSYGYWYWECVHCTECWIYIDVNARLSFRWLRDLSIFRVPKEEPPVSMLWCHPRYYGGGRDDPSAAPPSLFAEIHVCKVWMVSLLRLLSGLFPLNTLWHGCLHVQLIFNFNRFPILILSRLRYDIWTNSMSLHRCYTHVQKFRHKMIAN